MKKIMVIGKVGCGKTTLCQALYDQELVYKKTQAIEILGSSIDTPGEYLEHKNYCQFLSVYATEADEILLLQDVTMEETAFSPRMQCMFCRPMIGIVTKMDLCTSEKMRLQAETFLELAGAVKIFHISSVTGAGMEELLNYLCGNEKEKQGIDLDGKK